MGVFWSNVCLLYLYGVYIINPYGVKFSLARKQSKYKNDRVGEADE